MASLIGEESEEMEETLQENMNKRFQMIEIDPEVLRERGNDCFKNCDYWKAISYYTKSLARSPAGSRLRGLAYANRSAVLLTLGHYEESIGDALTALENDYPPELAHKMYLRMGMSKKAMGKRAKAEEDFQTALKLVGSLGLKTDVEEETKQQILKKSNEKQKPVFPSAQVEYLEPPEPSYGKNPADPMISSALLILKDGKGFVAKRKIDIGDIVLLDTPLFCDTYNVALEGESCWIYCSECFKMCLNLIPCSTCSWACYCSKECSDKAWEKQHKVECVAKEQVLNKLINDTNNSIPLSFHSVAIAFKLLATFGLDNCTIPMQNLEGSEVPEAMKELINLKKDPRIKISTGNRLAFEAIADNLKLSGMKKRNFIAFQKHALNVVTGRSHEIIHYSLLNIFGNGAAAIKLLKVGRGFYLRACTIESSCDPNVHLSFYQNRMVVRAVRPIDVGEAICQPNGLNFYKFPKSDRQQILALRNCKCEACVGDWRSFNEQPETHDFIKSNPAIKGLIGPFLRMGGGLEVMGGYPSYALTKETFNSCSNILKLYGEKRRDDQLNALAMMFIEHYFSFLATRLVVGSRNDKKLTKLIPTFLCDL